MKTGIQLIRDERNRQIKVEGWTFAHDDKHANGELSDAAACYAAGTWKILKDGGYCQWEEQCRSLDNGWPCNTLWPWHRDWWKPTPDNRIRELVKAGALIAAEIDRLQRAAQ